MKKKKGFTLVEIMIVVAIIALLAGITIPNLVRQRITANETVAQATLKTIAVALESYASTNGGLYPSATTSLLGVSPYLGKDYFVGTHHGFTFDENFESYSYSIIAAPINTSQGLRSFTITTGAVLSEN